MARKYGLLRSRLLLDYQVEIAALEQKLLDMDHEDSDACPRALKSKQIDETRETHMSRKDLMQEVDLKMEKYGMLLDPYIRDIDCEIFRSATEQNTNVCYLQSPTFSRLQELRDLGLEGETTDV